MMRKKPTILIILIIVSSVFLSSCAPEPTPVPTPLPTATVEPTAMPTPVSFTFTDSLGNEVVLTEPAKKIVSLAPSNTEILFAIGAGNQVIGRDSFSDFPEEALAIQDIGGGWGDYDNEMILSLEPDLVLAADIIASEQIQALKDLGVNVFALPNPLDIQGLYNNIYLVGALTGNEAGADMVIADLEARVASVEEKLANVSEKPVVFYELDGTDPNAPWTPGPGTFIELLINMAGGENLGSMMESAWAQVSVEQLVTEDPDIIILGDYTWGGVTPEMVAARAGWESLNAVMEGKVFIFDDNLVSRPGPRMVDGLEQMAKLLHPALFE